MSTSPSRLPTLNPRRFAGTSPTATAPSTTRSRDLLGQFLASYKINPVTALYVGYTGDYFELEKGNLEPTRRTFFVKLGYAFVL